MEQKKVQRIVGILVVVALAIVVMPLLFGKNNFPVQQAANIKAPPFPDQPPAEELTPTVAEATTPAPASPKPAAAVADQTAASADNADIPVPEALSGKIQPALVSHPVAKDNPVENKSMQEPSASDKQTVVVTPEMANKINNDSGSSPKDNSSTSSVGTVIYEPVPAMATTPAALNTPVPVEKTAPAAVAAPTPPVMAKAVLPVLAKTKNAPPVQHKVGVKKSKQSSFAKSRPATGWVVQMGYFSVKSNAIRMAHTLEASGYKAFTQDVKLHDGKMRTRVYIGPAFRQASATQLSREINQKLNMHGFVMPYTRA
ncbi:MAG TPA: SPOR domain-containing protein [Gammaproteobacteria bacterium]|nr:SPOR domain-containing protein [Gammaproteobacteria bacterium]